MLTQSYSRLRAGIESAIAYVRTSRALRETLDSLTTEDCETELGGNLSRLKATAPATAQWRALDHCAAVGRIYALFEQFIEGIISEWISFRSRGYTYTQMPESLQNAYNSGVATILGDIEKVRFQHINREDLVREYHRFISDEQDYKLYGDCISHHANNLRWDDLTELFGRCGLAGFQSWMSGHNALAEHFGTPRKLDELARSALKNLVQYRNDAAHGAIDVEEILGPDELIESANLVIAISTAVSEYINHSALSLMVDDGRASKIGVITERLRDNIVIANMEGASIKLGDSLVLKTDRYVRKCSILSIRIDDISHEQATIANPKEVGLKLSEPATHRANLIFTREGAWS